MPYKAILFDMDGTLVPMDMDTFTNGYFKGVCEKLAFTGMDPRKLVASIWTGTKAMVKNDGSRTNERAFWDTFESDTGLKARDVNPPLIEYYGTEFADAVRFTSPNPLARRAVELAREKAGTVVLATNPYFPRVGQETRMAYVGLSPKDFDYVSAYEDSHYCKPNPAYYREVLDRLGLEPGECLMIGNDEREDMAAASSLGMDCYLVTDCRIAYPDRPWEGPQGTFEELVTYLENL